MSKTLRHTIHRDHRHLYWDHAIAPALTIAPGDGRRWIKRLASREVSV